MSCYGLRGHVLADLVCARLAESCRRHPGTVFIFNSVLYTRINWLNAEIDTFNQHMLELSLQVPNLIFFDSSSVLSDSPLSRHWDNVIERNDPRRIHITREARILITNQLLIGVEQTCRKRDGKHLGTHLRNWRWPLRSDFAAIIPGTSHRPAHRDTSRADYRPFR